MSEILSYTNTSLPFEPPPLVQKSVPWSKTPFLTGYLNLLNIALMANAYLKQNPEIPVLKFYPYPHEAQTPVHFSMRVGVHALVSLGSLFLTALQPKYTETECQDRYRKAAYDKLKFCFKNRELCELFYSENEVSTLIQNMELHSLLSGIHCTLKNEDPKSCLKNQPFFQNNRFFKVFVDKAHQFQKHLSSMDRSFFERYDIALVNHCWSTHQSLTSFKPYFKILSQAIENQKDDRLKVQDRFTLRRLKAVVFGLEPAFSQSSLAPVSKNVSDALISMI